MSTWRRGRTLLFQKVRAGMLSLDTFLDDEEMNLCARVPGTAVFMAGNPQGIPLALLHNFKHNKVIHQRVIILTVRFVEEPYVEPSHRAKIEHFRHGFHRISAQYGFMERPNIPDLLREVSSETLPLRPNEVTYFLSRETLVPGREPGMQGWRRKLFAFMSNNAQAASTFFELPPGRVVELGMQVEF